MYLPGPTTVGSPGDSRAHALPTRSAPSTRSAARSRWSIAAWPSDSPDALEELLRRSFYAQPRFSLIVLGVFAVTGTLLVAIGVFSVMAYTVSRQTREIAVRMAPGRRPAPGAGRRAPPRRAAAGVGVGVGLLASLATSRLIANQLWNTSPHDPLTLAAAVSVIAVVALAACYLPALRAMRVDPMAALRHD